MFRHLILVAACGLTAHGCAPETEETSHRSFDGVPEGSAREDFEVSETRLEVLDDQVDADELSLRNGTLNTTTTNVGALIISTADGRLGLCTATLVKPNVVLTAAHCLIPVNGVTNIHSRLRFVRSASIRDLGAAFRSTSAFAVASGGVMFRRMPASLSALTQQEQQQDIALLKLTKSVPGYDPRSTKLPSSIVGGADPVAKAGFAAAKVLGYGETVVNGSDTLNAQRRAGDVLFKPGQQNPLHFTPGADGVIQCPGDSGGPATVNADGSVGLELVVGVTSAGFSKGTGDAANDCVRATAATSARVTDPGNYAWIEQALATFGHLPSALRIDVAAPALTVAPDRPFSIDAMLTSSASNQPLSLSGHQVRATALYDDQACVVRSATTIVGLPAVSGLVLSVPAPATRYIKLESSVAGVQPKCLQLNVSSLPAAPPTDRLGTNARLTFDYAFSPDPVGRKLAVFAEGPDPKKLGYSANVFCYAGAKCDLYLSKNMPSCCGSSGCTCYQYLRVAQGTTSAASFAGSMKLEIVNGVLSLYDGASAPVLQHTMGSGPPAVSASFWKIRQEGGVQNLEATSLP